VSSAAWHSYDEPNRPTRPLDHVRRGLRARWLLGPPVAGGPERRADPLAPGGPLNREPDVDGEAYAVADGHVQGLDAARRVDRHGLNSATGRTIGSSLSWKADARSPGHGQNSRTPTLAATVMAGRAVVRLAVTRKPSRQSPVSAASPANGAATAMPAALAEFIQVLAWV
jgi:hypothetical protein